jgi:hypothetical protein
LIGLNRRDFVRISAGTLLAAASSKLHANSPKPSIAIQDGTVSVKSATYSWQYSQSNDTFQLRDSKGRSIVSGRVQPAIFVSPVDQPAKRICSPGTALAPRVQDDRVTFEYEHVNGAGQLSVTWRFDGYGIWTDPIVYNTDSALDVVSLHYFTEVESGKRIPTLHPTYVVVP